MKKTLVFLLTIAMMLSLASCGKKVCKVEVCAEGSCTEVEIPCEDEENISSTDPETPPEEPTDTDTPVNTDAPTTLEEEQPTVTPPEPAVSDIPKDIKDPGLDYDNFLDVEQEAMNAFQAIVDGDYEGLLHMYYLYDTKFVSLEDIVTFFQISNYGALKGKDITIIGAKAGNQGYSRNVTISYIEGAASPDIEPLIWDITMCLMGENWKFFDENFIKTDWEFRTSIDTAVTIDGNIVKPISTQSTTQYFKIPEISRVAHEIIYTHNGQATTHSIVPGQDSGDMIYEEN